jgi:hypothetical protein
MDLNFLPVLPNLFISSPCQRQGELLPSLGIRRMLTFHINESEQNEHSL